MTVSGASSLRLTALYPELTHFILESSRAKTKGIERAGESAKGKDRTADSRTARTERVEFAEIAELHQWRHHTVALRRRCVH